ncbi:MAG: OmpA family protein [Zoogloeaceae bacterium]|nr:OmpA family protein [Rhodocyclaceae bacterium]MCP5237820.1 OmpA family protein [Zoogloeaceae bacterium]
MIIKHTSGRNSLLAVAMAVSLASCASAPKPNPQLDEARTIYRSAASDSQAAKSALVELRSAEEALQQAEKLQAGGADPVEVSHYAYLTKQRSRIAMEVARQAAARQKMEDAKLQRDRILIESRTQEAERAMASAEERRMEAERARQLAEQRLGEAERARAEAVAAQQRATALAAQIEDLQAKQTERGMVLTLGDVLFDTGKASLKAGAMRTIDKLASFLKENPGRRILIEGHTDSVGSEAFNQTLSEHRAESVRDAVVERGVAAERIAIEGLGEAYPVASNDNAPGRQQNRRVEVVFSDDEGQFKQGPDAR